MAKKAAARRKAGATQKNLFLSVLRPGPRRETLRATTLKDHGNGLRDLRGLLPSGGSVEMQNVPPQGKAGPGHFWFEEEVPVPSEPPAIPPAKEGEPEVPPDPDADA